MSADTPTVQYVVISQYRKPNGQLAAGNAYGPFPDRVTADRWIVDADFPSPEMVVVKRLHHTAFTYAEETNR